MKPVTSVTSASAKDSEKTASGATNAIPARMMAASARMPVDTGSVESVDIDSEAENAVEPTFATMSADDVALDMDTEVGYIT
jgi:hypothetical protein